LGVVSARRHSVAPATSTAHGWGLRVSNGASCGRAFGVFRCVRLFFLALFFCFPLFFPCTLCGSSRSSLPSSHASLINFLPLAICAFGGCGSPPLPLPVAQRSAKGQ
jgi:hypothetical protein